MIFSLIFIFGFASVEEGGENLRQQIPATLSGLLVGVKAYQHQNQKNNDLHNGSMHFITPLKERPAEVGGSFFEPNKRQTLPLSNIDKVYYISLYKKNKSR